jgi:hypothetical protein
MRNALVAIVVLALTGCGGPVDSDNDGGEDSTTDGPDIHVDVPTDTPTDTPTDGPTDTEEDSVPGCVTHQDCLPAMFCGPCTYTRCPCDPETMMGCEPRCEENPCWDGSTAECPDLVCPLYEVISIIEGECRCTRTDVCRGWADPGCLHDGHCWPNYYCNPCAHGSCPDCDDCVADCDGHGCPSEEEPTCTEPRPESCGEGNVSVVQDGCWVCVTLEDCTPV